MCLYSLRSADAFPVVASLPPRSDDRKCVCASQASACMVMQIKLVVVVVVAINL